MTQGFLDCQDRAHIEGLSPNALSERIRVMSLWIEKNVTSVLDFSAGGILLRDILPEGVAYYPVSYRQCGEDGLICDFAQKQFPEIQADLCFVSGCLEYVPDAEWFLERIRGTGCKYLLLSYTFSQEGQTPEERQVCGRTNDFTLQALLSLVQRYGFILTDCDNQYDFGSLLKFEAASSDALQRNYFCTGCGACANVCPSNAITMMPDDAGFLKPHVDAESCIHCDKCTQICPALHPEYENATEPACYAAWGPDDVRRESSSGGAFSLLAHEAFRRGGVVFGAAWRDDFSAHHIGIENEEELPLLRHSKYIQSDTEDSFRQAKHYLEQGRTVLYSGCPCQIAGLHAYLGKPYEKLVTVDVLCHYVPSPKVFQQYLRDNYGEGQVADFTFRDKTQGGSPYTQRIVKKDGSEEIRRHQVDLLQQGFHPRLFMNDTCANCAFARLPRQGDITLGDFWGLLNDPDWNDGKGTSEILINTPAGADFFAKMRGAFLRCEMQPIETALKNRFETKCAYHPERNHFLRLLLDLHYDFNTATEHALNRKFEIALVGDWAVENYGSNITYYALYHVLTEKLGRDVLLVERPLNSQWKPITPPTRFMRNPYPSYAMEPYAADKRAMKGLNERCDTFLVGSDQNYNNYLYHAFGEIIDLDWVTDNHRKVAYAGSFGAHYIWGPEYDRAKMACFMQKFDAFSVREKGAVDLIKREFNVNAEFVLDPVFLCDKNAYIEMAKLGGLSELEKSPSVFSYMLDMNEGKTRLLTGIAQRLGLGLHVVTDTQKDIQTEQNACSIPLLKDVSLERWMAYFASCSFVVTDSFHGVCFAIIFRKPFLAIVNHGRGRERFISILGLLGLLDRLAESPEEAIERLDAFTQPIHYDTAEKKLDMEIERSYQWLQASLKPNAAKKSFSDYNLLDARCEMLSDADAMLGQQIIQTQSQIMQSTQQQIAQVMEQLQQTEERMARATQEQRAQVETQCAQTAQNQQAAIEELRAHTANLYGQIGALRNSRSYKLGRALTWLPRKIRGGFRCIKQHGFVYTLRLFFKKVRRKLFKS